ncbi:MAG TPA: hypothetical protein VFU97_01175 [Xanthobacteraceae bacterium]|nr:hypothetical protein [Xanthobacteraceae bacterium]
MSLDDAGAIISAHSGGTVAASRPRARRNCALCLLRKATIPADGTRLPIRHVCSMPAQGDGSGR